MTIRIKLKGSPEFISINAESIEDDPQNAELRAKDASGKLVGMFNRKELAGWWIAPEALDLAEEIAKARQRVKE